MRRRPLKSDRIELKEVDQVEILSLSDNYNDIVTMDSNEIIAPPP